MKRDFTVNYFQFHMQKEIQLQILIMDYVFFLSCIVGINFGTLSTSCLSEAKGYSLWRLWSSFGYSRSISRKQPFWSKNCLQFWCSSSVTHMKSRMGKGWLIAQPYNHTICLHRDIVKILILHLDCISEPYICCLPWNIVLVSLRHRRDCLFQSPTTYLGHLRTRVEHQFFSNKRPKPIQVQ